MMRRTFIQRCAAATAVVPSYCDTTPIYTLEQVPRQRSYNFELPTLTKKGRFVTRVDWAQNDEHFTAHMMAEYPALKKFTWKNLAVAGGSIPNILSGTTPNDLDVYIIGDGKSSEEEQTIAMQKVAENFLQEVVDFTVKYSSDKAKLEFDRVKKNTKERQSSDVEEQTKNGFHKKKLAAVNKALSNILAVRSGRVITLYNIPTLKVPVQLVMVPRTINDILTTSDVDSGAVAWTPADGKLLFGDRSKFALTNFAIVSHSQEGIIPRRLQRYFNKGYDIILPELDMTKLSRTNSKYLKLPDTFTLCGGELLIECEDIHNNRIDVASLQYLPPAVRNNSPDLADAFGGGSEKADPTDEWDSSGSSISRKEKSSRSEAIRAASHNVSELLEGGNHYKYVLTGRDIVQLADPALVPMTERTISSVLNNKFNNVKNPLDLSKTVTCDKFLRTVSRFFNPEQLSAMSKELFDSPVPMRDTAGFNRHAEQVLQRWFNTRVQEGTAKLEAMKAARGKLSIIEQLGEKPSHPSCTPDFFYGALKKI